MKGVKSNPGPSEGGVPSGKKTDPLLKVSLGYNKRKNRLRKVTMAKYSMLALSPHKRTLRKPKARLKGESLDSRELLQGEYWQKGKKAPIHLGYCAAEKGATTTLRGLSVGRKLLRRRQYLLLEERLAKKQKRG